MMCVEVTVVPQCRVGQFEAVAVLTRLLAAGADVNAVDHRGRTVMCEALVHNAPAEVIAALGGAVLQLSRLDPATWPSATPTVADQHCYGGL